MPDISMCSSSTCPSRFTCYWHEAKPNTYLQSYTCFDALRGDEDRCGFYEPIMTPVEGEEEK